MSEKFLFRMPDIGEGVVEGEVISWLKEVGSELKKDEPVVVLMTDKATVELPTPHAGKLTQQFYKPGDIAKKDSPLFEVEIAEALPHKAEVKAEKKPTVEEPKRVKGVSHSAKVAAAPPVRKLAKDLGIDLKSVSGTGPQGRIIKEDIQRYTSKKHETSLTHLPGDREEPLKGIQNLMAKKMAESTREIPHFSYFDQADATRLVQLVNNMKPEAEKNRIKLTYMPFFIKALSRTIEKYPKLNTSFDTPNNSIIFHTTRNIGIAMTTPYGLIVPNLKGVEKMTLFELIFAYEEFKTRAKSNTLRPSEMKDGTITITNFGALEGKGVFATPIINFPEAAILGVARIHKQATVVHEREMIREILNCSWSFDHRIIDGDLATQSSACFVHLIENPAELLT